MPPYPVEILNFGRPGFTTHVEVARCFNEMQSDFSFSTPAEHDEDWAAAFIRDEYQTDYVWERLQQYRLHRKGFRPFLLAIVHGKLASKRVRNLFGSRNAEHGFAVVTTSDWEELFAPPSIETFVAYFLTRYLMSFVAPEMKNHYDTRDCFLDFKANKADIKLSMKSGRICDSCREKLEESIDGTQYRSLSLLVNFVQQSATGVPRPRTRPKVFIGSSSEGRDIAEGIQYALEPYTEPTVWTQGAFGLSSSYLESLVSATKKYQFAILVFTPDDPIESRGAAGYSARDNVLFELGLFMGALGRDRTFVVHESGVQLRIPSDLGGVEFATFSRHQSGNLQASLGTVCTRLRRAMGIQ